MDRLAFLMFTIWTIYFLSGVDRKPASVCPAREENESAFIYNMGLAQEDQHCKIIEKSVGLTIKLRRVKSNESKKLSELQSNADDEELNQADQR